MRANTDLIYKTNNTGPKTEPCGTPSFRGCRWWITTVDWNCLTAIDEIGSEPCKGRVKDTVGGFKVRKENYVINGIECRRQIKERQDGNLSLIKSIEEIVDEFRWGTFGAVTSSVGWLMWIKQVVSVVVIRQSWEDNFSAIFDEKGSFNTGL